MDSLTNADAANTHQNKQSLWLLTLMLGLMTAVGPFTVDMYLPTMVDMQHEFAATDTQIQLTMTGTMLGFALGQLLLGPLSDAYGRKRPLQAGIVFHAMACLLCLVVPSIETISVLRVLQGLGAAACGTIAMAMVRDLFTGYKAAKMFSRNMLILSVSPILAPTVGGIIAADSSWRYIFIVLALISLSVGVLVTFCLPESLPPHKRQPARPAVVARNFGTLFKDRIFLGLALVSSCGTMGLFFYISPSSFIMQEFYGLSPSLYGVVFASMAVGFIVATQSNVALLRWLTPGHILVLGVVLSVVGSGLMSLLFSLGITHIAVTLGGLFITLAGFGFMAPNVPALALMRYPQMAGAAAALLGTLQNLLGAFASPIISFVGMKSPLPMAACQLVIFGIALLLLIFMVRKSGLKQPVEITEVS